MRKVIIFFLDIYKKIISSLLLVCFGGGCRFYPTCGQYAKEAIERFGVVGGTTLAAKRVLRCQPFGGHGYDPVPQVI